VLLTELLQHAGVGRQFALRRLLAGLEAETVVQDRAQLGRGVEVELLAASSYTCGLERGHPFADATRP
jgi:hypothetical protein